VHPVVLAALYLGAARLLAFRVHVWLRPGGTGLARRDWPWLAGAILFGGVLGPVLLMLGLGRTSAASASLLLNLEAVLTALIAWTVFRENADRRIVRGMALIVPAGVRCVADRRVRAHDAIGARARRGPRLLGGRQQSHAQGVGRRRRSSRCKGLARGGQPRDRTRARRRLPPPELAARRSRSASRLGVSLVLFVVALRGSAPRAPGRTSRPRPSSALRSRSASSPSRHFPGILAGGGADGRRVYGCT
jgi:hypothetical protein